MVNDYECAKIRIFGKEYGCFRENFVILQKLDKIELKMEEIHFVAPSRMKGIYYGMLATFCTPMLLILILFLIASNVRELPEMMDTVSKVANIAMIAGALVVASRAFAGNEEQSEEARAAFRPIGTGALILIVPALVQLGEMGRQPDEMWMMALPYLAAYLLMAMGYQRLCSATSMRGTQLVSRGFIALAFSVMDIWLLTNYVIHQSAKFGEDLQQVMLLCLLGFMLGMLIYVGGLFAVIYGSRFVVDSAQLDEEYANEVANRPEPTAECPNRGEEAEG